MTASFWKDRSVLVTGHTGFKGSWLSVWLVSMGAEVFGYSLDPPTSPSLYELAGLKNRDPQISQMMQIFKDNGGKPLGRYKTIEKITGSQAPEMIAIVSFENAETIKKMLDGDEYKSLSELRERVFNDLKIVLCVELN